MAESSLKTLGATNLAIDKSRSPLEYYGTDPKSTRSLLEAEEFDKEIWEPCAGHHLIVDVLKEFEYNVKSTDIFDYGFNDELVDFLNYNGTFNGSIVSNPPFNLSTEFVKKALNIVKEGHKVAMFLRLQWLEGTKRYDQIFKDNPPKTVYIFVNRQVSSKNDDFSTSSAVAFVWIVWEKGYKGNPEIKWLKNGGK